MIRFSHSATGMRSSEIRRLMSLAADPSIISFAGGMPANSLFPIEIIDEIYGGLSREEKQVAMQYGPTSGYPPLIAALKVYLQSRGILLDKQGLIITTGAQQAINLVCKVMLDPGDVVITEYPSFIGALAAFKSYGAEAIGVPMDDEGIIIDQLATVLDSGKNIQMLYLSPSFHNPAGITYSISRKQELCSLLKGKDLIMLEDDPYSELYFDPGDKALTVPMKALGNEPVPICYVGTFAKILGPGMRLGWVLGPSEIIEKCELAKQSMDACTATFTQVLAHQYLAQGKLPGYLEYLRPIYKRRAGIMLDALRKYMPSGVEWTAPKGGFYVWVTLPVSMNSSEVFAQALKAGAAFVIGCAFDPAGAKNNSFRLAFSYTPEDKIEKGIQIIATAVKSLM